MPRQAGITHPRNPREASSRTRRAPVRSPTGAVVAQLALLALFSPGCLYLDDINSPPQAQIETVVAGPYLRGTQVALRADKSDDPNGDTLEVDWKAFTCSADRTACDAPAFQSLLDAELGTQFLVNMPTRRPNAEPNGEPLRVVAVEAEVFDNRRASHKDRLFIDLANQDPAVSLSHQGYIIIGRPGYPVGTSVHIVATGTDPEADTLTYEWSYTPVSGSTDVGWESVDVPQGANYEIYSLHPDVPGSWRVDVTVTDELGAAVADHVNIEIQPDSPPCIASLDPLYVAGARYIIDRDGPVRRFTVLAVDDDLDSYPRDVGDQFSRDFLGTASFRWQIASPDTSGQLVEVVGHSLPDYLFDPTGFAPGDRISLRVEAIDRIDRALICGDQDPTCSLVPNCMQRVTWDLEVR